MSLLDRLAEIASATPDPAPSHRMRPVPHGVRPAHDNLLGNVWGRRAPGGSADLDRVLALPRRHVSDDDKLAMAQLMTRRLRRERTDPCACASFGRRCVLSLKPVQGWALYELATVRGLLGPIGVGHGKTALDFLAPLVVPKCRTAVLLLPPGLVNQLENEYRLWSEHWQVPSLIVKKGVAYIQPGKPALHVIPYSKLSQAKATVLLDMLAPDLVIADESHKLRHADTARTSRFLRYFVEHSDEPALACWSGSMTDRSIKDYAHLSTLALKDGSPLPIKSDTIAEWSVAVDPPPPGQSPAPIGELARLCEVGESLRDGFRRRLLDTPGVVATNDPGIGASLYMHERDPGTIPPPVQEALDDLRGGWVRPDGEELVDALSMLRCARELTAGFFYRWIFPHGEPQSLIDEWIEIRRNWHREVRRKLQKREPHLDQPLLLAKAAIRHYDPEYKGDLPTWDSVYWPKWRDIRYRVRPETEAVWIDDYLAQDAAKWGAKHRGVIWYQHSAFGRKVAEISGLPMHAGGPGAEDRIKAEKGDRSIVASIKSHGTGRDGLQFLFSEQLVANPPESKATGGAALWEQLMGRLHREGQEADQVDTWIYRHTEEMRDAWDRAKELAMYVTGTMGSFQKLLCCSATW